MKETALENGHVKKLGFRNNREKLKVEIPCVKMGCYSVAGKQ